MRKQADSKIVSITETFASLALLNLCWLVCSLPLITILPATNALFYMMHEIEKGEKEQIISRFWKFFKETWSMTLKKDWLIGIVGCILMGNIVYLYSQSELSVFFQIIYGSHLFLAALGFVLLLRYYSLNNQGIKIRREQWILAYYYTFKFPATSVGLLVSIFILLVLFLFWPALSFFFLISAPAWLSIKAIHKEVYS
jgi:uncharacterized membrane protein YesL